MTLIGPVTSRRPTRLVHLGLGAFHRSHQAWYTDADPEWGIAAFGGRGSAAATALAAQHCRYTLLIRGREDIAEPIGSIVEAHPADRTNLLAARIAHPDVTVVTMTITERGYADVSAGSAGARLLAALDARRRAGGAPIALVPCDNIPSNGAVLRTLLVGLAADEAGLVDWLSSEVSFVSTSVDRITPRVTAADLDTIQALTGVRDECGVVTEPFSDFTFQGSFPGGRPAWEIRGAHPVDDVEPYERRKLWLLNGAHSLLAYSGLLRGHRSIAESIADPLTFELVERFWDEACGHLSDDLDLDRYRSALLERFANPRLVHEVAQVAVDGVVKLRARIPAVALAERAAGRDAEGCAAVLGAWIAVVQRGDSGPDSEAPAVARAMESREPVEALVGLIDTRLGDDIRFIATVARAAGDARLSATKMSDTTRRTP